MDLIIAAKILYDRWCTAHKGRNPDGSALPCWDELSGEQRATWTSVVETAFHHIKQHLEAVQEYLNKPRAVPAGGIKLPEVAPITVKISGAAIADAASEPGYAAPELREQAAQAAPRPARPSPRTERCIGCRGTRQGAPAPQSHERACPDYTEADAAWCLAWWQTGKSRCYASFDEALEEAIEEVRRDSNHPRYTPPSKVGEQAAPQAERAAWLRLLGRMRLAADLLRPHELQDYYHFDPDVRAGMEDYVAGRESFERAAARTIRALVKSKENYAYCLMKHLQPPAPAAAPAAPAAPPTDPAKP